LKRMVCRTVLTLLVLSMLALVFRTQPLKSESAALTVDSVSSLDPVIRVVPDPVNITGGYSIDHTFVVAVNLYNVTVDNVPGGLVGVEIYFTWNNTLIVPVSFFDKIGLSDGVLTGPNILYGITPGFYDDAGNVISAPPYAKATQYKFSAASADGPWWGNGTLTEITFQIVYQPVNPEPPASCTLALVFTRILDENEADVTHEAENGSYTIQPFEGHDLIMASVSSSKTIVGQGWAMQANVTIINGGIAPVTFNLTLYANVTQVGTQTVLNLMNGTDATIVINGEDTSSLTYGNYILSAYAWPVNMANNNCTGGQILITIPGDIDGNFKVQLSDLVFLAQAYSSKPHDPNWNPNADIDGNTVVGLSDLVILAQHYGQAQALDQNDTTEVHLDDLAQVTGMRVNNAPYFKNQDMMNFTVTLQTISEQTLAARGWPNATLSVGAYDAVDQPIGIAMLSIADIHATRNDVNGPGGTIEGIFTYTVIMPIPSWAAVGAATVTGYVLTDLPSNGGVPLGPQLPAVIFSIETTP